MLNGPDLEKLLRLFDNEDNTMGKILDHFKKDFSYDRFKVCYALSLFTEENVRAYIMSILLIAEDADGETEVLRVVYYSLVFSGGTQEQQASLHRSASGLDRE